MFGVGKICIKVYVCVYCLPINIFTLEKKYITVNLILHDSEVIQIIVIAVQGDICPFSWTVSLSYCVLPLLFFFSLPSLPPSLLPSPPLIRTDRQTDRMQIYI